MIFRWLAAGLLLWASMTAAQDDSVPVAHEIIAACIAETRPELPTYPGRVSEGESGYDAYIAMRERETDCLLLPLRLCDVVSGEMRSDCIVWADGLYRTDLSISLALMPPSIDGRMLEPRRYARFMERAQSDFPFDEAACEGMPLGPDICRLFLLQLDVLSARFWVEWLKREGQL